ncbi:hypothetical protein PsorP6_009337 [Peronosclerospora sorghi]|uniref:Uncharacterized protein n=1 Tax=Peronosclerospora sorghi TaxID=230839 RepID=A0ACC0W1C1_9STRA|nr:hypothetical protein PsorP6_009337 [Peronosclerospora sorghi]
MFGASKSLSVSTMGTMQLKILLHMRQVESCNPNELQVTTIVKAVATPRVIFATLRQDDPTILLIFKEHIKYKSVDLQLAVRIVPSDLMSIHVAFSQVFMPGKLHKGVPLEEWRHQLKNFVRLC